MKKKLTMLGASTLLGVTSVVFAAPAGHADDCNDGFLTCAIAWGAGGSSGWNAPSGGLGAWSVGSALSKASGGGGFGIPAAAPE